MSSPVPRRTMNHTTGSREGTQTPWAPPSYINIPLYRIPPTTSSIHLDAPKKNLAMIRFPDWLARKIDSEHIHYWHIDNPKGHSIGNPALDWMQLGSSQKPSPSVGQEKVSLPLIFYTTCEYGRSRSAAYTLMHECSRVALTSCTDKTEL